MKFLLNRDLIMELTFRDPLDIKWIFELNRDLIMELICG